MATHNPRLLRAGGRIAALIQHHGADSPQVAEAKAEVRLIRAELAIEDLINSAPPPTPEQIRRLRDLLPPVGEA